MYKVKFPNVSIERKFFKDLEDIELKHLKDEILEEAQIYHKGRVSTPTKIRYM